MNLLATECSKIITTRHIQSLIRSAGKMISVAENQAVTFAIKVILRPIRSARKTIIATIGPKAAPRTKAWNVFGVAKPTLPSVLLPANDSPSDLAESQPQRRQSASQLTAPPERKRRRGFPCGAYNAKIYIMDIIEKALKTHSLNKAEITELLLFKDASPLYAAADETRKKYVGDAVHLRGLIEFSNICKQNCLYCGLRRDNKKVKRYRLSAEEIISLAEKAKTYGYKTVVLQSGEDVFFDVAAMTHIIKSIKAMDLAITLSLGEKTFEEYRAYREAGADRYLLRIETTDKALYERLDPGMSFENRLRCLRDLKKLGYEVGSGIMAGLPGQSAQSIAEDILFMKNLPVHMAGIGPFIAHPDTPLAADGKNNFETALKTMAVARLLMPFINIPATTAMEALDKDGRVKALKSGANVVMPNVTEGEARKLYILYPGKICTGETPSVCRGCIESKIKALGRSISADKGVSKAYRRENSEETK